jgi:hypothetical protein
LARKCNANTHKWDDPIPQCVANNGTIMGSNALYDSSNHYVPVVSPFGSSPTISNSATIKKCMEGYLPSNYISDSSKSAIQDYVCSYKDGSKHIDQVYFNALADSGKKCVKYCLKSALPTGYTYSGNEYIEAGTPIDLGCPTGYGKAIDNQLPPTLWHLQNPDIPRPDFDNSCGRDAYDRTTLLPTITCNADGSWGTVSNPCVACRGCSGGPSKVSNPDSKAIKFEEYKTGCLNKSQTVVIKLDNCDTFTMAHNITSQCKRTDHKSVTNGVWGDANCTTVWDMTGYFNVKCIDGALSLVSSTCDPHCPTCSGDGC